MTWRDKVLLAFFIWLGVYPVVLFMSWLVGTVGVDPPLPLKVLITTMFTVPTIEFIVLRRAKKLAAGLERRLDIDGELRREFGGED
jgi:antibiotic biosynthesis monooxygenase (ABM) superfamily enzyme